MEPEGLAAGLRALRAALLDALSDPARRPTPALAGAAIPTRSSRPRPAGPAHPGLLTEVLSSRPATATQVTTHVNGYGDSDLAVSSSEDASEGRRLIALVELARGGDKEAFGQLYDHYHGSVFRFLYYRLGSTTLAEDLTAETFFRALRAMNSFRWQGKDFGAWLMTISRNLATDHFKAGRTRLEHTTEDMGTLDTTTEGPEGDVLASLTNETLMGALKELPTEQRECLVMRFLEGLSIAETAEALGRSAGAVKQLQLRGVRNLAKLLPQEAVR